MLPREHDIMRAVEDQYWWYLALRPHVLNYIQPVTPVFYLLDAGCGTGGMLEAVRRSFPQAELTALDYSERAVELTLQRNTGACVVRASVNDIPFPDASFDFVLAIDVWTSIGVDDALAAHEAYRVLRPGGKLIVNLAAFKFLRGAHDAATAVRHRYTRPEVRALLEGANFEIERITYWNASLTAPFALVRWLSRRRLAHEEPRSDFRPIPSSLNRALRGLAALELQLSRHLSLPFGTSVFAVARKHG